MFNIHKIADEIFKAPSQDDILQRVLESEFTKNSDGTYSTEHHVILKEFFVKNGRILVKFKQTGNFSCDRSNLVSLEGCPDIIDGDFSCTFNDIGSLEGGPKIVTDAYYCDHNSLISLKGAPKKAYYFSCTANAIRSLEGSPEIVEDDFKCQYNALTSLKGAPKTVGGNFNCFGNPGYFSEDDVRAVCEVKGRCITSRK